MSENNPRHVYLVSECLVRGGCSDEIRLVQLRLFCCEQFALTGKYFLLLLMCLWVLSLRRSEIHDQHLLHDGFLLL